MNILRKSFSQIRKKKQKNAPIYEKVFTDLKSRSAEQAEEFEATIPQLRNKFKKCVGECKKAALTITTRTGIKRFQDSKSYGKWFNQLFQSRDSC